MGKLINRVGEVHNYLRIIEELGTKNKVASVRCVCTNCGSIDIYAKSSLIKDAIYCRSCGYGNGARNTRLEHINGLIINNMTVTSDTLYMKEYNKSFVMARCNKCGKEDIYDKRHTKNGNLVCKNCNGHYGDIRGIFEINEYTGNNKYNVKCTICGKIQQKYLNKDLSKAKCDCQPKTKQVDDTGKICTKFIIVEDLGRTISKTNSYVKAQCKECNQTDTYLKRSVIDGTANCKHCGKSYIKNRVGEVHNGLRIVKELGKELVTAQCLLCGTKDNYDRGHICERKTQCRYCGLSKNYKGKVINNITVHTFGYIGRNGQKYYLCSCNECREELLLTREEIVAYKCDKK